MSSVLVTGASRGIGHAIARTCLNQGYRVVGTSRQPESIDIEHAMFTALRLDLEQVAMDPAVPAAVVDACGDVDALVLNAGAGRFGSLEEFSHAQIQRSLNINLLAQIQLARAFVPQFKRRGSGDLIFIGSESALSAGKQGTLYSAAKFGLRGFARALRLECASATVRVGLINPGMVSSGFFDGLAFEPGPDSANRITPGQVVDAVMLILGSQANVVFDEINLSPLKKSVVKKPAR